MIKTIAAAAVISLGLAGYAAPMPAPMHHVHHHVHHHYHHHTMHHEMHHASHHHHAAKMAPAAPNS
jgi:hypothetical protein